jgi:hypothetical protein
MLHCWALTWPAMTILFLPSLSNKKQNWGNLSKSIDYFLLKVKIELTCEEKNMKLNDDQKGLPESGHAIQIIEVMFPAPSAR